MLRVLKGLNSKSQLEPIIENPGNMLGAEQGFGRWFTDSL